MISKEKLLEDIKNANSDYYFEFYYHGEMVAMVFNNSRIEVDQFNFLDHLAIWINRSDACILFDDYKMRRLDY